MVFILKGAGHLRKLARKRGCGQAEPEPGHLHGNRGTAHTPCPAEHPRRSPEQGQRIDAGVPIEMPILVKQHRPHHLGRDLVQPDTDTVFFIFGKAQPEQIPVPIQHQRRKRHAVQERRFGTQDKPVLVERRSAASASSKAMVLQQRNFFGKRLWRHVFDPLGPVWGIAHVRCLPNLTVMTLPPLGLIFLSHTSLSSNHNIIRYYIKHPER